MGLKKATKNSSNIINLYEVEKQGFLYKQNYNQSGKEKKRAKECLFEG